MSNPESKETPTIKAANALLELPGIVEGVCVNDLSKLVNISNDVVMLAINHLLNLGKVHCGADNSGKLICKLKQYELSLEGLDIEERAVYEVIGESGNQGIWIRDIRTKTNLMMKPLNKILKTLETKKKIKAVKSVLAGKRKVYMLFDMQPDSKVTGDLFYSEQQEFDTEFTDVMFASTLDFLRKRANDAQRHKMNKGPLAFRDMCYASTDHILEHIQQSKVFTVKIGQPEMLKVLSSLKMSGKIESCSKLDPSTQEPVEHFRVITPLMSLPSLARMPCGTCPLLLQCSNTGNITPAKCTYLEDWLNMDLPTS